MTALLECLRAYLSAPLSSNSKSRIHAAAEHLLKDTGVLDPLYRYVSSWRSRSCFGCSCKLTATIRPATTIGSGI